ncbi:Protein of unknown function [Anaerosphaera aminiphila DSM 21120]|uniref:DUF3796 domain-containing protein n=1 Tax=Anaerosphaera aminiphila DSM 21120 TaxID=1120995 RepID=A0A1M5V3T9_9FIRM|nr:DUF3796 domain-containing protein [Anaerosphaera aminiphila]SHH69922.1 Protein of unknown function [Anaerosphaera aminiphila DSM 21120]
MKNKYGFIGFLSLLGFWGLHSGDSIFLFFFAFVVFFQYFWIVPDEMFVDTIRKCATYAFFANLFTATGATLVFSYFELSNNPMAGGTALGFGISVAVFVLMTFIMELKERLGASNDKK